MTDTLIGRLTLAYNAYMKGKDHTQIPHVRVGSDLWRELSERVAPHSTLGARVLLFKAGRISEDPSLPADGFAFDA